MGCILLGEKFSCQAHIVHIGVCKYICICVYRLSLSRYMHTSILNCTLSCVLSNTDEFGRTWSNFDLGLLRTCVRKKLHIRFRDI